MPLSQNILAEQNIYARLVVSKIPPKQTPFQTATIANSESDRSIYSYYGNDNNIPNLTLNADVNQYSITSLPDTVAYLPRNSIFDRLMLITSNDQDYRKLKVTSSYDTFDMSNGPTIAGVNTPSVYNNNVTQAIYRTNQISNTNLFTSQPPNFNATPTQELVENTLNEIVADPRFNDLDDTNLAGSFGDLHLNLKNIVDLQNTNNEQTFDIDRTFEILNIPANIVAYVRNISNIADMKKNDETIQTFITLQLITGNTRLTESQINSFADTLQNSVKSYNGQSTSYVTSPITLNPQENQQT